MKRKLIVANWKMNQLLAQLRQFFKTLADAKITSDAVELVVCPSLPYLASAVEAASGSKVAIGAQNVSECDFGAFTGEVAAQMLTDIGCKWVLIGHSERRSLYHETDELVGKKTAKALSVGLNPILCVGETLAQREAGITDATVQSQLRAALKGIAAQTQPELVFAYEPVWAIGTGKTATAEEANRVHGVIRQELAAIYGEAAARSARILYGGSAKPDNAASLLQQPHIDGLLIGGASLAADSFAKIAAAGVVPG